MFGTTRLQLHVQCYNYLKSEPLYPLQALHMYMYHAFLFKPTAKVNLNLETFLCHSASSVDYIFANLCESTLEKFLCANFTIPRLHSFSRNSALQLC